MQKEKTNRRPIRLRENKWLRETATWLARVGMRPNQVSMMNVVFAGMGGICLILVAISNPGWRVVLFIAAALSIPLRGLCNLCDGLMAVEGGLKTRSGEIFNDLPDRLSDSLLLVAAGYSITGVGWGHELGWAAAILAVLTAYVRVLGGSAGASQQFCGPMAKTQRMLVIMAACLIAALEAAVGWNLHAMVPALFVIIVGCVLTIFQRTRRIVNELELR